MNATPMEIDLVATFVAVADETSFSRAAARLGVTKGTVSRAVQRLEVVVGAKLFHRTTHAVALSTAGAALYERSAPHLRALSQALGTMPEREREPAGLLRLTAPPDFGTIVLPPLLAQFGTRFPGVRFDLQLTNLVLDVVKEKIDLAIRPIGGPLRDSSLVVRKLGRIAFAFYASPAYLAIRGVPHEIGEPKHEWVTTPFVQKAFGAQMRDVAPRVIANDVLAVRAAVAEGLGVGCLPEFVAEPGIANGTLTRVLSQIPTPGTGAFALVYPSAANLPRKVTAFRDFLIERMAAKTKRPPRARGAGGRLPMRPG